MFLICYFDQQTFKTVRKYIHSAQFLVQKFSLITPECIWKPGEKRGTHLPRIFRLSLKIAVLVILAVFHVDRTPLRPKIQLWGDRPADRKCARGREKQCVPNMYSERKKELYLKTYKTHTSKYSSDLFHRI